MITIHKYPIDLDHITNDGTFKVQMPQYAKMLSVGLQPASKRPYPGGMLMEHQLVVWAEVNPQMPMKERRVFVATTGDMLPEPLRYFDYRFLGTLQMGGLVLHIYSDERVEVRAE